MPRFTPTQSCIVAALSDGEAHPPAELLLCLQDAQASVSTLWVHLSHIRAKLRPLGEDVLCVLHNRRPAYRHVRLLKPAGASSVNPVKLEA